MITLGTTFSGIGAPEQALKNLDVPFKTLWACDIDKWAKKVYMDNHDCEVFYDDITTIPLNDLKPVDIYIFGFPCQDLSTAGKKDLSKGRSNLVEYSIQIIDKIKPKYFIFENVKGLLSKKFSRFFASIISRLSEHYDIHYEVLNSCNFNIPQNRERVFGVGIRKDLKQPFYFSRGQRTRKTLADVLDDPGNVLEKHWCLRYPYTNTKNYRQYILNGNHKSHSARVYYTHSLAPTLNGSNSFVFIHNNKIRKPTPNELKRLQGFPVDFRMDVSYSTCSKLIGNSITVPVLESIFRNLLK